MKNIIVALLFGAAAISTSCKSTSQSFVNVNCVYTFKDVVHEEDQQKLENTISSIVGSDYEKTGSDVNPTYTFVAENAMQIDDIHNRIGNIKSGGESSGLSNTLFKNNASQSSAFYIEKPQYSVSYGSIGLEAKVEVIVKFTITQGSKLWYKPQGQLEIDITDKVDSKGSVRFETKIYKNQEFILGRTSYKNAERFIKVNIFTGEVTEIKKNDYK